MIEPNRIDAGVVRNLLKRAGPNTDPNPLIEEAFRRGFAKRGESWRPFDVREEAGALFFGVTSSQGFA
jgi:hypothetical protein